MPMQVFLFARCHGAARSLAFNLRCTLIAFLSVVLCPSLIGQMARMRVSANTAHVSSGAPFRSNVSGFGRMRSRSLSQRSLPVQRFPRRHLRFNPFFANACFNNPFFDPFLCRRFFLRTPVFVSQAFYVPYPIQYPIYADQPYAADQQAYAAAQQQENQLIQKVDRLADEVESFREQQALTMKSPEPQAQREQPSENQATKILVFRDGHRTEIKNYALIGKTLWVLTEQRARRIPVSELDMDASKQLNDDHGIAFP